MHEITNTSPVLIDVAVVRHITKLINDSSEQIRGRSRFDQVERCSIPPDSPHTPLLSTFDKGKHYLSSRHSYITCLLASTSTSTPALIRLSTQSCSLYSSFHPMPTILQRARAAMMEGDRNGERNATNTNTAGQPLYMPKQGEYCVSNLCQLQYHFPLSTFVGFHTTAATHNHLRWVRLK